MRKILLPMLLSTLGVFMASAQDLQPCLVFSGNAEENRVLALQEFNRITFGENSMTISNHGNPGEAVELLYSEYNRFRVTEDFVSEVSEVVSEGFGLVYDAGSVKLTLNSGTEKTAAVGVFNLDGVLVAAAQLENNQSLDLKKLSSGVYVAIATGEDGICKIKFIK